MKLPVLVGIAMLGSVAMSNAQAAPMGEAFQYNPAKLQQVCRGKSQGAPVSLAMNGVVFNGTCEYRYIPNSRNVRNIDPMEADQACSGQASSSVNATVDGKQVAGKCALAFRNIGPSGNMSPDMSGTGTMPSTTGQ
ncbi:hypothetical protein [Alkanindiges illinoisensis]|uniref:hypothetical protein n=1 Tax=Alkanindiges illinoisensis TaxID=197183 RepID=UPI0012EC36D5|nr:hypothetical protein [Alkanindiges illinoisensis]